MLDEAREVAIEVLGWPGRMISQSKSGFRERHPDHAAVFNANLCVEAGKIWFGDLDLTIDEPLLLELANQLDEQIYVLREMDGRFKNELRPLLDHALYRISPEEQTSSAAHRFVRAADGSLRSIRRSERYE